MKEENRLRKEEVVTTEENNVKKEGSAGRKENISSCLKSNYVFKQIVWKWTLCRVGLSSNLIHHTFISIRFTGLQVYRFTRFTSLQGLQGLY